MKFNIESLGGVVTVNDKTLTNLNISSIPINTTRVTWSGSFGTREFETPGYPEIIYRERIFDIGPYLEILDEFTRISTLPTEVQKSSEDIQEESREAEKTIRELKVRNLKVTTKSGRVFDGDEVSQGRMSRAILTLQFTNTPSTLWVLADNTPVQVTIVELSEALALAGAAQSAVWVIL